MDALWDVVLILVSAGVGFGLGRLSKRLDRRQDADAAEAARRDAEVAREAAREARWSLRWKTGSVYELTNDGDAGAAEVLVTPLDFDPYRNEYRDTQELNPGETYPFLMAPVPPTGQVEISWTDESGRPRAVRRPMPMKPRSR